MLLRSSFLILSLLLCIPAVARSEQTVAETCSITGDPQPLDPNLKPLTYDLGDGPKTMMAYVTPDVTTFYKDGPQPPAKSAVPPEHKGLAAKFINMSNKKVRLYWQPYLHASEKSLMRVIPPFSSTGSASFPGHHFFISSQENPDAILQRYEIGPYPANLYFYDPYFVPGDEAATVRNLDDSLSTSERALYDGWNKTRAFNEVYRNFTGRSYLANYLRDAPKHYIWPADYFGQEHWVTTKETHFTKMPPSKDLTTLTTYGTSRRLRDDQPRLLSEYRTPDATTLNLTLKVVSCAPRVYVIENFLSPVEVAHMMYIAAGVDMHESLTGDAKPGEEVATEDDNDVRKTRTSFNSWLSREESPIVDAIYRRASDLLRIDEALMRYRPDGEHPEVPNKNSIAEHLQLVHYDLTQEYTAHHDYGFNEMALTSQPERFATLVMYLNEGMEGGETSFPRWINAESGDQIKVTPKIGRAALFYGMLPDGNMDDFSQHAALPVTKGEKWMTNLWVWDPYRED